MTVRTIGLFLLLALVGCGGIGQVDGSTTPTTGPGPTTSTPSGGVTSTTMDDAPITSRPGPSRLDPALTPDWFVNEGTLPGHLDSLAREAISNMSGIAPGDLTLEGAMFVTWNDSSLGCARPSQLYLQVLTDGYLAYYEGGGSLFRVHTNADSTVIVCDLPFVPEPQPSS